MTEPQIWVLIGIFAAAMFGALGLIVPLVNQSTRSAVDAAVAGLRGEMAGGFAAIDAKFGTIDARFEAMDAKFVSLEKVMNARFDAVGTRLDNLDRDVTAITKKVVDLPDN